MVDVVTSTVYDGKCCGSKGGGGDSVVQLQQYMDTVAMVMEKVAVVTSTVDMQVCCGETFTNPSAKRKQAPVVSLKINFA